MVLLCPCRQVTRARDWVKAWPRGTADSIKGNTIFVALGASGQSPSRYSWAFSLLSIGCYSLGTLFFARLNTLILPPAQRRMTLMTSFLLQAIFILVSAVVIQTGVVGESNAARAGASVDQWSQFIPIALLSFQSAGQIVTSRAMNINEVPTVVITSLLCDLFSDVRLLAPVNANVKRNRRIAGFLLVLVGAIVSGWIAKATGRIEPVLWMACGLKLAMFLAWTFWPWVESEKETSDAVRA